MYQHNNSRGGGGGGGGGGHACRHFTDIITPRVAHGVDWGWDSPPDAYGANNFRESAPSMVNYIISASFAKLSTYIIMTTSQPSLTNFAGD